MCCQVNTWEKAFALFIGFVFLVVAVFMGISLALTSNNNAVSAHTITAKGDQCYPMPGDPDGIAIGELIANLNTKTIEWDLVHDSLSQITWLRISGPVGGTTTRTGPVLIWLCGGEASDTCKLDIAHRVSGKLTQDSNGYLSPRSAVEELAERPGFYYLEIATTEHPNCAIRAQLGLTSGPGRWGH